MIDQSETWSSGQSGHIYYTLFLAGVIRVCCGAILPVSANSGKTLGSKPFLLSETVMF
jgi:hypothetical protein